MLNRVLLILIGCFPVTIQAQTFDELFKQKKTQIQYLITQIAELQIYLQNVKKGYEVVRSGMNTVKNIRNGEFTLHDLYYTSMGLVNPLIRQSPGALQIARHLQYTLKAAMGLQNLLNNEIAFNEDSRKYIRECIYRLLEDAEKVRLELLDLTTDNSFELSDDQRLNRLAVLNQRSLSQVKFIKSLTAQIVALIRSIEQEQLDSQTIRSLHEIR